MTDRLAPLLEFHPFTRLNALLAGVKPGGEALALSVGEPQGAVPPMVREIVDREAAEWSRYPLATGTAAFRQAVAAWLTRRFGLPEGMVEPELHVAPAAGSREALFMIALSAVPGPASKRNLVLMPNPFYHVYAGAASVAGGEPHFLPATAETGFLPDPDAVPAGVLERTALAYINSPSNPQGAVASPGYLRRWVELARHHGFVAAFDECYSEIWLDAPPPGALSVCAASGGDMTNIVVFHSLSKRSGVPGLRSGFTAGDQRLIRRQVQLVNYGGVAPPYPVLAASTALWRDEAHVEAGRRRYRENFAIAERVLGGRFGWTRSSGQARGSGGFFLWLDVGDGEAAALALWRETGIRVLPGGYMAQPDSAGRNPGAAYIRVALVHEPEVVEAGLSRLVAALDRATSFETPARARRGPAPQDEDYIVEKKREPHPEEAVQRPSRRVAS